MSKSSQLLATRISVVLLRRCQTLLAQAGFLKHIDDRQVDGVHLDALRQDQRLWNAYCRGWNENNIKIRRILKSIDPNNQSAILDEGLQATTSETPNTSTQTKSRNTGSLETAFFEEDQPELDCLGPLLGDLYPTTTESTEVTGEETTDDQFMKLGSLDQMQSSHSLPTGIASTGPQRIYSMMPISEKQQSTVATMSEKPQNKNNGDIAEHLEKTIKFLVGAGLMQYLDTDDIQDASLDALRQDSRLWTAFCRGWDELTTSLENLLRFSTPENWPLTTVGEPQSSISGTLDTSTQLKPHCPSSSEEAIPGGTRPVPHHPIWSPSGRPTSDRRGILDPKPSQSRPSLITDTQQQETYLKLPPITKPQVSTPPTNSNRNVDTLALQDIKSKKRMRFETRHYAKFSMTSTPPDSKISRK